MEHVWEKILYPAESTENGVANGGGTASAAHGGGHHGQSLPAPLPENIEERIELFCNDQVFYFGKNFQEKN